MSARACILLAPGRMSMPVVRGQLFSLRGSTDAFRGVKQRAGETRLSLRLCKVVEDHVYEAVVTGQALFANRVILGASKIRTRIHASSAATAGTPRRNTQARRNGYPVHATVTPCTCPPGHWIDRWATDDESRKAMQSEREGKDTGGKTNAMPRLHEDASATSIAAPGAPATCTKDAAAGTSFRCTGNRALVA